MDIAEKNYYKLPEVILILNHNERKLTTRGLMISVKCENCKIL